MTLLFLILAIASLVFCAYTFLFKGVAYGTEDLAQKYKVFIWKLRIGAGLTVLFFLLSALSGV